MQQQNMAAKNALLNFMLTFSSESTQIQNTTMDLSKQTVNFLQLNDLWLVTSWSLKPIVSETLAQKPLTDFPSLLRASSHVWASIFKPVSWTAWTKARAVGFIYKNCWTHVSEHAKAPQSTQHWHNGSENKTKRSALLRHEFSVEFWLSTGFDWRKDPLASRNMLRMFCLWLVVFYIMLWSPFKPAIEMT